MFLKEFLDLYPGEQLFVLMWGWGTRKERQGSWLEHFATALDRANEVEV